ncbi:MAG TPA: hypothetical protein VE177_06495, partial [Candidatus Binatus sp.]|nr:hypothetical protein [Candidatus Binatus sp.]
METSLEAVLRTFLSEDVGYGDITTTSLVIQGKKATGYVLCKESCIVAGMNEARILLEKIVGCKVTRIVNDGARVKPGTVLIHATGP